MEVEQVFPSPVFLFRVDGDAQIGIGHVMRCIALAQALQEVNGQPVFVMTTVVPALQSRLESFGMKFTNISTQAGSYDDSMQTARLAKEMSAVWVILDGYHFDDNYQKYIKDHELNLLILDDYGHSHHYFADLVLNQNIYAQEDLYVSRELSVQLLLGVNYSLLRSEFLASKVWSREIAPAAQKILVTLGGGDLNNVTAKVIQAIAQINVEGLEVVVIVGGSNPHLQSIEKVIQELSFNVRLISDPPSILGWMKWADIAVSGGGSTCYELAFLGLPSLIIVLAENQRMVAAGLESAGISINLGWHLDVTPQDIAYRVAGLISSHDLRAEMSRRGRELVDGNGAMRVVQKMYGQMLALRNAHESDSRLIFEWANDPATRSVSFSTEVIPWETHQAWYLAKLQDPYCIIFMALEAGGRPVGMVRYQLEGMESVVSINLDPNQRGKGYGAQILKISADRLFRTGKTRLIHAYIKPDNVPSIRAFTKAGFEEQSQVVFHGNEACHFILSEV
jgi:UDP-2,4-diacetamido-2,4,6-trideoxy-beta-L-altropyranose hydrolase